MNNRWKIKREFSRVVQQLRGIPEACYEPIVQRRHDHAMKTNANVVDGVVPLKSQVAVILIYQPQSLNRSLVDLCKQFVAIGFAPLIVSNTELSVHDMETLQSVSWRVLQRPNFGYDFGGYRDAVLHLMHQQVMPAELVIMNDSVWCPLTEEFSIIEKARELPADIVGGVMRQRGESQFLESYFYLIKRTAFDNPLFRDYWQNYRLTSNKYWVIRRGERGFSSAMQQSSLSVDALFHSDRFIELLSQKNANFLRLTLEYGCYRDHRDESAGRELLANYEDRSTWRDTAVEHVRWVLGKEVFNSSFCYASIKLFDFPFLKKSQDPINIRWREKYRSAVINGDLPAPSESIWSELQGS